MLNIVRESLRFWRSLVFDWSLWLALSTVMLTISLVSALVSRDFIDGLVGGFSERVLILGISLLGLTLVGSVVNTVSEYIPRRISVKTLMLLVSRVGGEVLRTKSQLLEPMRGDILARLSSDIMPLAEFYGGYVAALLLHVIRLCFGALTLILLSPLLTLFAVSFIPIYFLLYRFFSSRLSQASEAERSAFSGYLSVVKEHLDSHELFKRTMALKYAEHRLARFLGEWAENYRRLLFLQVVFNQSYYHLYSIMTTIMLVIGGVVAVKTGEVSVGTLVAFIGAMWNIYEPVINLSNLVTRAPTFIPLIKRYNELLDLEKETGGDLTLEKPITRVSFRELHVMLGDREVLRDVSAELRSGRIIAITGPSGSGKTTLARVLTRLVDPLDGVIELDGVDYKRIRLDDLRREVYYVPARDVILRGSVRENIALGGSYRDEEILKALELSDVDFVSSLDEEISPERLSEGQKQRLALARAILRRPSILILDEALSSIEEWREKKILEKLREYLRESLIIIVSHRSSVLSLADEIYVIEDGVLKRVKA